MKKIGCADSKERMSQGYSPVFNGKIFLLNVRFCGRGLYKNSAYIKADGFMLIETLIAVVMLAAVLTVAIESIRNCLEAGEVMRDYSKGMYLAKAKMCELEHLYAFRDDILADEDSGIFDDPKFAKFSYETIVEMDESELIYYLTVIIKWTFKNRTKQYQLDTIVPMPKKRE